MLRIALLAGLAALPGIRGEASAQLANSAWPMFHHDARHTGQTTVVGPQTAALRWTTGVRATVRASPSVGSDGTIYLGVARTMCAFDGTDGTEKWCNRVNGHVRTSTVAIDVAGNLYFGARDNKLWSLTGDGEVRWTWAVGVDGDVSVAPVIGPNGSVYFVGTRLVHAVTSNGALLWRYTLDSPAYTSSPAIGPTNLLYVASTRGIVHAITQAGAQAWEAKVARLIKFSPVSVASDGTAYVGSTDGLEAVNPDGTVKWEVATAGRVVSCPAIASNGTIYVGSLGSGAVGAAFYAVSPGGSILWTRGMPGKVRGSAAIGGDGIIYTVGGSTLMALRPNDGSVLWAFETGRRNNYSSPAIGADGTLYFASGDRTIYAFGP